jgi:hypothetical protein
MILDIDAHLRRDIDEAALAVILPQDILAIIGHEDVEQAVIVEIADGTADAAIFLPAAPSL